METIFDWMFIVGMILLFAGAVVSLVTCFALLVENKARNEEIEELRDELNRLRRLSD